jgi:Fic family protein
MNYLEQLSAILRDSGWSQEELARHLGVSFPALNAWLRERAAPRSSSLSKIESLYLDIVGSETVDVDELKAIKSRVQTLKIKASKIIHSRESLDALTLYLTYHTNTIEGSTMTLADVGDVIFEHKVLLNRTAIEQAEARNHQAALYWVLEMLEQTPDLNVTEEFVTGIHLRLMNGIVSDAGQYRHHSVRIMGSHTTVANWLKVPELMSSLVVAANVNAEDTISKLAQVHADFEKIHPFSDGNGRTGRLLLLVMALRAGLMPPVITKERKHAYYKYLEMAQVRGDYAPLELFVAESMLYTGKLLDGKG